MTIQAAIRLGLQSSSIRSQFFRHNAKIFCSSYILCFCDISSKLAWPPCPLLGRECSKPVLLSIDFLFVEAGSCPVQQFSPVGSLKHSPWRISCPKSLMQLKIQSVEGRGTSGCQDLHSLLCSLFVFPSLCIPQS